MNIQYLFFHVITLIANHIGFYLSTSNNFANSVSVGLWVVSEFFTSIDKAANIFAAKFWFPSQTTSFEVGQGCAPF